MIGVSIQILERLTILLLTPNGEKGCPYLIVVRIFGKKLGLELKSNFHKVNSNYNSTAKSHINIDSGHSAVIWIFDNCKHHVEKITKLNFFYQLDMIIILDRTKALEVSAGNENKEPVSPRPKNLLDNTKYFIKER